jgi:hypothetical protein
VGFPCAMAVAAAKQTAAAKTELFNKELIWNILTSLARL